jgi:hypothetical protein
VEVVIFIVIAAVIVIQVIRAARSAGAGARSLQAMDQLGATGVPARGLVLTCSPYSTSVTINGRRFEKRTMTLDVEIPGRPPYQSSGDFLIPRGLVEAIPGASLDLTVDPSNPDKIVVLGPGGFTGPWLRLGPPQPY